MENGVQGKDAKSPALPLIHPPLGQAVLPTVLAALVSPDQTMPSPHVDHSALHERPKAPLSLHPPPPTTPHHHPSPPPTATTHHHPLPPPTTTHCHPLPPPATTHTHPTPHPPTHPPTPHHPPPPPTATTHHHPPTHCHPLPPTATPCHHPPAISSASSGSSCGSMGSPPGGWAQRLVSVSEAAAAARRKASRSGRSSWGRGGEGGREGGKEGGREGGGREGGRGGGIAVMNVLKSEGVARNRLPRLRPPPHTCFPCAL